MALPLPYFHNMDKNLLNLAVIKQIFQVILAKYNINLLDFNRIEQIIMIFYNSLWKLAKFPEISKNFTVYYGILLSFCSTSLYISLSFSFAFGPFKNWRQNFDLWRNFKIAIFQTWQWQKLKKSISQISRTEPFPAVGVPWPSR